MNECATRNYQQLWHRVITERQIAAHGIHGPTHWTRVERNGIALAMTSGATIAVVQMFALFHDIMRVNDGADRGHGKRGGEYARTMRHELSFLDDAAFETLVYACQWHTNQTHHDDPTIATCWDADRLDLDRVGIAPAAKYLNTAAAKEIVRERKWAQLEQRPIRDVC